MYRGRRFTESTLRIVLLSTFRVSSINDYLACSLPVHKIYALCGIFSTISVLFTTENSDDLESYTSEFLIYHFLLVINCTRGRILYRFL